MELVAKVMVADGDPDIFREMDILQHLSSFPHSPALIAATEQDGLFIQILQ